MQAFSACIFPLFSVFQKNLSRNEIINHHDRCCSDLGDHIENMELVHCNPHDQRINPQSDHTEYDKDRKILCLASVPRIR